MFKVLCIVREAQTVSGCDCLKSTCNGIGVDIFGNIGSMDNPCQTKQPCIFQVIFQDDRLKGTATFVMTNFHAGRVEGNRASFLGEFINLAFGCEQEFRFIVNESRNEPGTSHSVDVDMGASDPFHKSLLLLRNIMRYKKIIPY